MEYIYKLNVPLNLNSVFTADFINEVMSDKSDTAYKFRKDLTNIFKKEWVKFNNISWDFATYFNKHNAAGYIHDDILYDLNRDEYPWGVTFVLTGECAMLYWDKTQVNRAFYKSAENTSIGSITIFKSDYAPIKSYYLLPGIYLVNAFIPHLAIGFNHRKILSLRSSKEQLNTTWQEVVNKFADLIE